MVDVRRVVVLASSYAAARGIERRATGLAHPLSPWTFHPNAAGMRAVADAIHDLLAGG